MAIRVYTAAPESAVQTDVDLTERPRTRLGFERSRKWHRRFKRRIHIIIGENTEEHVKFDRKRRCATYNPVTN
jgi:hypothetical protein